MSSKMKSKSSIKKRFKITGGARRNPENNANVTLTVISGQAGKRHGMTKRTNKQIRNQRGTTKLKKCDAKLLLRMMPYAKMKKKQG